MSMQMDPAAPLIAETGGLNALIVDSTALPEQAIKGHRCLGFSVCWAALLCIALAVFTTDISGPFLDMLYGAMDELVVGDPWDFSTDLGPCY